MVGWSRFSLVPDHPVPMAGYKPRNKFTGIKDTVYMRVMAFGNGATTAYIISADLLLFPPALKTMIYSKMDSMRSDFIYFSASHTHTSVGGWDPSILGRILMGEYNEAWVDELATATILHMQMAKKSMKPAKISYWEKDANKYIDNRVDSNAMVDGKFRGLKIDRIDGQKAQLFAIGAHPTMINKRLTSLSGDYPAETMKYLARDYDFTLFMAGAVGSQRFKGFEKTHDFILTDKVGKLFSSVIENAAINPLKDSMEIKTGRIKMEHGPSQLRVSANLKLRDWVFRAINKPLEGEIMLLKLGDLLMVGMPCDFAGEISVINNFEGWAASSGMKLMITSFNGEYTGYITADAHYRKEDDEELRILNWVGPYFGAYYSEIMQQLIVKAAQ